MKMHIYHNFLVFGIFCLCNCAVLPNTEEQGHKRKPAEYRNVVAARRNNIGSVHGITAHRNNLQPLSLIRKDTENDKVKRWCDSCKSTQLCSLYNKCNHCKQVCKEANDPAYQDVETSTNNNNIQSITQSVIQRRNLRSNSEMVEAPMPTTAEESMQTTNVSSSSITLERNKRLCNICKNSQLCLVHHKCDRCIKPCTEAGDSDFLPHSSRIPDLIIEPESENHFVTPYPENLVKKSLDEDGEIEGTPLTIATANTLNENLKDQNINVRIADVPNSLEPFEDNSKNRLITLAHIRPGPVMNMITKILDIRDNSNIGNLIVLARPKYIDTPGQTGNIFTQPPLLLDLAHALGDSSTHVYSLQARSQPSTNFDIFTASMLKDVEGRLEQLKPDDIAVAIRNSLELLANKVPNVNSRASENSLQTPSLRNEEKQITPTELELSNINETVGCSLEKETPMFLLPVNPSLSSRESSAGALKTANNVEASPSKMNPSVIQDGLDIVEEKAPLDLLPNSDISAKINNISPFSKKINTGRSNEESTTVPNFDSTLNTDQRIDLPVTSPTVNENNSEQRKDVRLVFSTTPSETIDDHTEISLATPVNNINSEDKISSELNREKINSLDKNSGDVVGEIHSSDQNILEATENNINRSALSIADQIKQTKTSLTSLGNSPSDEFVNLKNYVDKIKTVPEFVLNQGKSMEAQRNDHAIIVGDQIKKDVAVKGESEDYSEIPEENATERKYPETTQYVDITSTPSSLNEQPVTITKSVNENQPLQETIVRSASNDLVKVKDWLIDDDEAVQIPTDVDASQFDQQKALTLENLNLESLVNRPKPIIPTIGEVERKPVSNPETGDTVGIPQSSNDLPAVTEDNKLIKKLPQLTRSSKAKKALKDLLKERRQNHNRDRNLNISPELVKLLRSFDNSEDELHNSTIPKVSPNLPTVPKDDNNKDDNILGRTNTFEQNELTNRNNDNFENTESKNDQNLSKIQEELMLNEFGKVIPADGKDLIGSVYFDGNGIKLPLKIQQNNDGSVQLLVDVQKLCKCNDQMCPLMNQSSPVIQNNILDENKNVLEHVGLAEVGHPIPVKRSVAEKENIKNTIERIYETTPMGTINQFHKIDDEPEDEVYNTIKKQNLLTNLKPLPGQKSDNVATTLSDVKISNDEIYLLQKMAEAYRKMNHQ